MTVVEDPGTYLGVPTMWGRLKRDALAFIKERVLAKILGWKQQFLSQCWRLLHELESLWVKVLKDRYFPQDSFFTAKRGGRASWVWSSLLEGWDLIIHGSRWQVSSIFNGRSIPTDGGEINKTRVVASIIDTERRTWSEDEIRDLFSESAGAAISRIHIGDSCSPDHLFWPASKTNAYSVKLGYWWLRNSIPLGSSESKSSTWEAFADANSRIHGLAPSPRNNHLCEVSWSPPPPSVLKINVDVSWRHGASSAWVGLVIHDSSRRCLEVRMMKVLASSAAMAESLVVLEGRLLAKGLNFPRVVIESDSKLVTSCLQDCSSSCAWELFPIQDRVFGWLGRLSKLAPGLGFQDQQTVRRTSL
ncbi:hypothetical protein ACFX1Q_003174 [Malus domestica]